MNFKFCLLNFLVSCGLLLSLEINAQLSGNYTINANSSRSSSNFQNFNQLATALDSHGVSAPIVVDVVNSSGPYSEQVVFTTYNGVSRTNNITIKGHGETIQSNQTNDFGRIISIDSSKHITIDSLVIRSLNSSIGVGVHLTRHADSNVIRNCVIDISSVTSHPSFSRGTSAGITIAHPTSPLNIGVARANYNTFDNNLIIGDSITNGGPTVGIYLQGIQNVGNKIINNTVRNFHREGIVAHSQDSCLISGNMVSRPKRILANVNVGIVLEESSQNSYISNNRISHISTGIFCHRNRFKYNNRNSIINNVVYNTSSHGGVGITSINSHGVNILHNTIIFDDPSTILISNGAKTIGITADGSHYTIRNNNISLSNTADGDMIGLEFGYNTTTGLDFDYNNIYVFSKSNVEHYHGQFSASQRYRTLADWKAVNLTNGHAQNSTSLDPLYTNADDFIPRNPYLNNTGSNSNVSFDINNTPRSSSPDVGAVEFDSTASSGITYPYYAVGLINKEDQSGFPDSAYVRCRSRGVIVGVDLDSDFSFQYFLIDQSNGQQEGIILRGFDSIPGSLLLEGDSVEVTGTVLQKTGNPYLSVHSIKKLGSNRSLPIPIQVDSITDSLQGKLVEIRRAVLGTRYNYSTRQFYLTKNNALSWVYIPEATKITDTITFSNSWYQGDSLCSTKGVVVQDDFRFFPTRVRFSIFPRYAADLTKASNCIITSTKNLSPDALSFKVYPNPTHNGIVNFSIPKGFELKTIQVFNIQGKKVFTRSIDSQQLVTSLNLSHLKSGVYNIQFIGDNFRQSFMQSIISD